MQSMAILAHHWVNRWGTSTTKSVIFSARLVFTLTRKSLRGELPFQESQFPGRLMFAEINVTVDRVKLLPLPQPSLRARTDARTNPNAQRATQLRSVLARV
jgi:hypothetical protein